MWHSDRSLPPHSMAYDDPHVSQGFGENAVVYSDLAALAKLGKVEVSVASRAYFHTHATYVT